MAFGVPVRARVQKIRRRGPAVEIESFVGVSGEESDRFILKNEVPQTVKDRPALVNFNLCGLIPRSLLR